MLASCSQYASGIPVVVCDDGDDERTAEVVQQHGAELITLPFDSGLSAGRTALVNHCRTPWVALYEDDFELIAQTQLPLQLRTAREHGIDMLAAQLKPRSSFMGTFSMIGLTLRMHKGVSRKKHGNLTFYDYVPNSCICNVDAVKRCGFDDALKLNEHWDFFWRGTQLPVPLVVAMDERFVIKHVHDASDPIYNERRGRSYIQAGLQKHGFKHKVHK